MARTVASPSRLSLIAFTLLAALCTVGCTANRYTFESSAFSPKTVEVVDQLAQETLWAMDVPVGQKLILDFDSEREGGVFTHDPTPPQTMSWELQPASRHTLFSQHYIGGTIDQGKVQLPGNPVVTRVTLRPVNRNLQEPMPELFEAPTEPASFSEPAPAIEAPSTDNDAMEAAPEPEPEEEPQEEAQEESRPLLEGAPEEGVPG